MERKKVYIVCATGPPLTMLRVKIEEFLKDRGINVVVSQYRVTELAPSRVDADVIVATTGMPDEFTAVVPVIIDADLVITRLKAKDRVEVITVLSEILLVHGYVTEHFDEAVLAREESFPTGLPLPDIPVAIPHAEAAYCRLPAIAVARLDEPVDFCEMGGDPDSVLAA